MKKNSMNHQRGCTSTGSSTRDIEATFADVLSGTWWSRKYGAVELEVTTGVSFGEISRRFRKRLEISPNETAVVISSSTAPYLRYHQVPLRTSAKVASMSLVDDPVDVHPR